MQSFANIFKDKTHHSPLLRGVAAALTVEAANAALIDVLGEKIIDLARAVYVKNRTLSVACLSSAAAQEIKLNERKILAKINSKAGEGAVEGIRYLS